MIIVFISYSEKTDGENARKLKEYLRRVHGGLIYPILAPREIGAAEDQAKRVGELIRTSPFFVVFYTERGKKSLWVNQEIGYAVAIARELPIRIIPLFDRRKDFEGMLNSRVDNICGGFQIERYNLRATWRKVGDYLINQINGPIEIGVRFLVSDKEDKIPFELSISNETIRSIEDISIHFVFPHPLRPIPSNLSSIVRFRIGHSAPQVATTPPQILPEFHEMQPVPESLVPRLQLTDPLKLKDVWETWFVAERIPPRTTVVSRWFFPASPNVQEFNVGLYVTVPLFEPELYECNVKVDDIFGSKVSRKQYPQCIRIQKTQRTE